MTSSSIRIRPMHGENPYRVNSRLHAIFNFIADEELHTLAEIVNAVYYVGADKFLLNRRRTASALRTMRQCKGLFIDFLPVGNVYSLSDDRPISS
ncbi:hypothetical protein LCGC14_0455350 [marine sediment metagenome]|uniref:Uncharacterized protein n=1 Tax=marine sediment metagenome TaxID=412755 RepID=A0A0F9V3I1_9ZZZZ